MEVYNCLNDIPDSAEQGFLYIFNIDCYEQDLNLKLDDVLKIGKTNTHIKTRLSQYRSNMTNISFVNCNVPEKRERLLKAFIKQKLNIKPICGSEYFKYDRNVLNNLILYFANEDEKTITFNHSKYEEDRILPWFDIVYENINNSIIPCKKESNKEETFKCNYCNSTFTCNKNLLRHLRTIKPCCDKIKLLNIKCIWCEKTFLSKIDLENHICSSNKDDILLSYIKELKAKDYIIKAKDEDIKQKDEYINRLNDNIKDLNNKIYQIALNNINNMSKPPRIPRELKCDYPLILEYDRVFYMMKTHIYNYINEEKGVTTWFLRKVCTNEEGNICIECTDKFRKIFKYIDDENKVKKVTGEELCNVILKASEEFQVIELEQGKNESETIKSILLKLKFQKTFIKELSKLTYINSFLYVNPIQEQD